MKLCHRGKTKMRVGSLKSGTDWRIVCAQLINHDSCVESWKKICIYSCVCLLVVLEHASILSLIYLFGSSYSHTNGKKNEITFRLDWQTKILALAISSGAWGDKVGPSYIINFRVGWIIGKQTKSFAVWHLTYYLAASRTYAEEKSIFMLLLWRTF